MTERLKTEGESPRDVARTVNLILDGKINSAGDVTLATGTTTTRVLDFRCSVNSKVFLTPATENAAAAVTTTYVTPAKQSFTVNHGSASSTDRTFGYVVLG